MQTFVVLLHVLPIVTRVAKMMNAARAVVIIHLIRAGIIPPIARARPVPPVTGLALVVQALAMLIVTLPVLDQVQDVCVWIAGAMRAA